MDCRRVAKRLRPLAALLRLPTPRGTCCHVHQQRLRRATFWTTQRGLRELERRRFAISLVAALLSLLVSGGAAQAACQCVSAGTPQPEADETVTRALHRLLADETVTQALHRLLLEERDTEQARELFIAFGSTVEGGAVESAVEGGGAVVKPDPPPAPLSEEAALEVEIADLHTMLEIERRRQRGGDQSTRCPPPPVDGPPPLLPAPILSYWQWRVGALHGGAQSADLGRIAELFAELEIAMGRWQELDDRLPLIQALMPHGQWQGLRKMLSYDGAIGGRDLTNYVYGAGIQLFCNTSAALIGDSRVCRTSTTSETATSWKPFSASIGIGSGACARKSWSTSRWRSWTNTYQ